MVYRESETREETVIEIRVALFTLVSSICEEPA